MMFATTAFAAETVEPRGSNFFVGSSVYFWNTSGLNYQIWFDVTAKGTMTELGASEIVVQRSTDERNWTTVRTYYKENYSQMTNDNTFSYANCVPFTATAGYSYRAIVMLYARNNSGSGYMQEVTEILDLR
jgi:hypothetical protein